MVRHPRPKVLDAEPVLFDHGRAGATPVSAGAGPAARQAPAGGAAGTTDEWGGFAAPAAAGDVDASVRDHARRIAARLQLGVPRHVRPRRSAAGELRSVRSDTGIGDVDLDGTLDALVHLDALEDADIVVRERQHRRRSVVVLVDVSGSMRGERVRIAAACVGALAGELADDEVAVVAFWSDAAVLRHLTPRPDAVEVVDALAALAGRGLTNVAFALDTAGRLLASGHGERRVVLLSDCVHNAGPDPVAVARRLPRLDVLVEVTSEHDLDLARRMARAGRGRAIPVHGHRDAAVAIGRCFADRAGGVRR